MAFDPSSLKDCSVAAAETQWRRGRFAEAAVVVGLDWKKDHPVGVVAAAAGLNWKKGHLAEAFPKFQTCYFAVAAAAAAVVAVVVPDLSVRRYYSSEAAAVAALLGLEFQAFPDC